MFPRMRLLFPQRHISLLHLKEKIALSNKKAPAGDSGYLLIQMEAFPLYTEMR